MMQPDSMEKKISVVLIGVTDMGRAVRFYRDVLRLPLKFQTEQYTEFATRGAVLALEKRQEVAANGPAFTFPTADIREDGEHLAKSGVKFWKELREESYGWLMMPQDSEGNIFEIVQYKS
jgi:predicted enzyme related to lactoylglutathione lyase